MGEACSPLAVRRSSRNKQAKLFAKSSAITIPDEETRKAVDEPLEEMDSQEDNSCDPLTIEPKSCSYNKIEIEPINNWIGNQLSYQNISQSVVQTIIKTHDNYRDGLLAIPSTKGGPPRIIVPASAQEGLVTQAHLDIHHQNHRKVHNILYPLYWWRQMDRDIERICKACSHCQSGKMRREKIKSEKNENMKACSTG